MALFILPFSKICLKCKSDLSLSEFYKQAGGRKTYRPSCKRCIYAEHLSWKQSNPEKYNQSQQEHCQRNRDARRQASRNFREANLERVRAYGRQYWRDLLNARPEEVRERDRKKRHKRRLRLKSMRCDLTLDQWDQIKAFYMYKCAFCEKRTELTQDHVIPVSKGGEHTASNIIPLCRPCNSKKGNRPIKQTFQPHLFMVG